MTQQAPHGRDAAMISTVLHVALGGAIGAAARYLTGVAVVRIFGAGGFPLGVLVANLIGSFLMGIVVVWFGRQGLTHLGPFVMTGILGGFTTFSAFSLETVTLLERGQHGQAALYMSLSVAGAIGALMLGIWIARGSFA